MRSARANAHDEAAGQQIGLVPRCGDQDMSSPVACS
jgi:hypothetical protein